MTQTSQPATEKSVFLTSNSKYDPVCLARVSRPIIATKIIFICTLKFWLNFILWNRGVNYSLSWVNLAQKKICVRAKQQSLWLVLFIVTSPQLRQKISSILEKKNRTEKDLALNKGAKSKRLHSSGLTALDFTTLE